MRKHAAWITSSYSTNNYNEVTSDNTTKNKQR